MAFKRSGINFRVLKQALSSELPVSRQHSICSSCRKTLRLQAPLQTLSAMHSFSTSSTLLKKPSSLSKPSRQSPAVRSPKKSQHRPDNAAMAERDKDVDPYDFSELEAGISSAVARLKDSLTRTRDAGRVTSEMIENLPVDLNIKHPEGKGKEAKPHHERTRLGDLASVVPKGGRMMQIFAAEESHIKPLSSSIIGSDHSLVPQIDQYNPLLILVPVPPATAETRQQAAAEAKKVMDKAALDVRNARGDAQKRFRKMELGKLVVADELRKAHKVMEEVVRKGQDEVKKVYEGALRALQQ